MKYITTFILLVSACGGVHTNIALAGPIDYSAEVDSTKFGDLKQTEVGDCGKFACGPTAVTNSFQFLENKYPKIYAGKLIRNPNNKDANNDGKVDKKDALIETAKDLATNYMDTIKNNNTLRDDLYFGKEKYITKYATDSTIYSVMDDPELNTLDHNGNFDPNNLPSLFQAKKPTPQFLSANLKSGEDIEILITTDNGKTLDKGHYLTVTKIEWNDKDGSGTINAADGAASLSYIDPITGTEGNTSLRQDGKGLLFLDTFRNLRADIRFVVKESPKPPQSIPTGEITGGTSNKSLLFDVSTGALSLTPFELSSAYITQLVGNIDTNRVDNQFSGDPILGATVTVTPFQYGQHFDDGSIAFGGFDGTVTISKDEDIFLTAFVPTLIFDPNLDVPFYAPLHILDLDVTLGSAFIDEMQNRLFDTHQLPFDLFIDPVEDILISTQNFTENGDIGVSAAIGQNFIPFLFPIPEPPIGLLLSCALLLHFQWYRWRKTWVE